MSASSAVRLVVNADDLGLVPSVNRGIIESIERGIVTSASLMVNMPGVDDAIARLARLLETRSAPSVGLHFNIVAGRPLTACDTLLLNGEFLSLPTLIWRALSGGIRPADVERELEAQLARATELLAPLGLRISHLDSHRHAHCLTGVLDVVVEAAHRHGIAHVRHPREPASAMMGRPRAILASAVLRAFASSRQPLDDVHFTGVALMASHTFERDVERLASLLPSGTTELMVHPGYDSPELAAIDPYRAPRERELRALTSPALRERLQQLRVELTSFGLPAPARSTAATA